MKRLISSQDTVALYVENVSGDTLEPVYARQWRGRLIQFLEDNEIDTPDAVLAVVNDLDSKGVHRMGGGAAPTFELRLIACEWVKP
jgi:hypothetical protein